MTERTASRLAWGAALLAFAMAAVAAVFLYSNRAAIDSVVTANLDSFLSATTLAALGGIVASRRPGNAVGWLFLGLAVLAGVRVLSTQLAIHGELAGMVGPKGWPAWLAWTYSWVGSLSIGFTLLVFLLFPDGKPAGRRWRPVTWIALGSGVLFAAATTLDPTPLRLSPRLPALGNPVGIRGLGLASGPVPAVLFLALLVVAVSALLVRLRRSRGAERQQLKWIWYATAAVIAVLAVGVLLLFVSTGLGDAVLEADFVVGFNVLLPLVVARAILKHGLYDIDRVINRTLVYALLTVLLGAVYAGLAVGLGSLARSSNSLVIAGSTLVVAALFRPARRRIQLFIDRRFYRRRYDAERTLAAFSATLRDEVDLDALSAHVLAVVRTTMQPAGASIWLREVAQ